MPDVYYQTIATIIPVLLIAGMLNPALLREYSKTRFGSRWIQVVIAYSLFGTLVSIIGSAGGFSIDPESLSPAGELLLKVLSYVPMSALSFTCLFVFTLARFTLVDAPPPDRLQSEKRDLEAQLRLLNAKINKNKGNDTDASRN